MKKRILSVFMILVLVFSMSACSFTKGQEVSKEETEEEEPEKKEKKKKEKKKKDEDDTKAEAVEPSERQFFFGENTVYYDESLVPSIEPYHVEKDFSNVVYEEPFRHLFDPSYEYYYAQSGDPIREGLINDNFVVLQYGQDEFFDVYEGNRYNMFPNFITVDSLMHTYHIYFVYLLKNTEREYLSGALSDLSDKMIDESLAQFDALSGTEWEEAAFRNVVFFTVGAMLQDDSYEIELGSRQEEFDEAVKGEIDKIYDAAGIDTCFITDDYEDYTQYKPRGYYEGDKKLEAYFRAMMWYGRIPFYTDKEDLVKSSALIVNALNNGANEDWANIYLTTSFFAGASDDPGYYELKGIVDGCFGEQAKVEDMAEDKDGLKSFEKSMETLKMPQVNSVPVMDGEDPVKPSFRFMGQRFTIDASIMQNLVYDSVGEDADGNTRMLPDTLDVAGVLGSDTAEKLLKESGAFDYDSYTENYNKLIEHFNNDDPTLWSASISASWLNTLRPLLEEKQEGYPSYKLSEKWNLKSLETFLGSYSELKHDTILYAKSVMAEMGGPDMEEIDDRGYVDPEPVIYSNFINLAENTKEGLNLCGMLDKDAEKDLDLLIEIADKLLTISEKELRCESLTDEEYDFIREYGGNIEHFWYEANKDDIEDTLVYSYQAPCPVIADIATDPNGSVLEIGTGDAATMYVVFPIDGELHVGSGSVYSFYQFEQPMSDRLTDSEWREMLEPEYDPDTFETIWDNVPKQPEWTQSYRVPLNH